jgi:lipopolysaccharide export system protein LptA
MSRTGESAPVKTPQLLRVAPIIILTGFLMVQSPMPRAERADRERPLQIEADRLDYDDVNKVNVFNGRVSLSKGSLLIRADRIVLRAERDGTQNAIATGRPATLRQRRDAGSESWVEGQGERIEWDSRTEIAIFSQKAQLRRLDGARVVDDVQGGRIRYNTGTETYEVDSSGAATTPDNPNGRVRVTIQLRAQRSARE